MKGKFIGKEEFRNCLNEWQGVLHLYILPALSMTHMNAAFNVKVWNILKFYDQTEHWGMYGEWAWVHTLYLELMVHHVEVTREV